MASTVSHNWQILRLIVVLEPIVTDPVFILYLIFKLYPGHVAVTVTSCMNFFSSVQLAY